MSGFSLTLEQLQEIRDALISRIDAGLKQDGTEIACLPTYLGLPTGEQRGQALVIDTGGTNTRAALVELSHRDGRILAGPQARRVPDGRDGQPLQAEVFYRAQAELAWDLERSSSDLPLGYCFSYPARVTEDGDAVLLKWTKGLSIDGVVGEKVGSALKTTLESGGYRISGLSVLNDTVASLIGGAHLYADPRYGRNYIGLILGTGTNMAGVFSSQQLTKIRLQEPMVVNLESGNFNPPHLNSFDDAVDADSNNPGGQRFEKAVSGHYLPYLFDKVCPGVLDPTEGTQRVVEIRDGGGEHSNQADAILTRSAHLAAAGLAALASFYPPGDVAVLGEGSLLWGDSQYVPKVRQILTALVPDRNIELVKQRDNVNLLGAASAALESVDQAGRD